MQGSDILKTAVVRKLRADFNHNRIPGLTEIPVIIQDRPLNNTPEPYIYIQLIDVTETDLRKTNSSYIYTLLLEVLTRSQQNEDSKRTRDNIVNECCNILEVQPSDYLDLTNDGFNNHYQTIGTITPNTFEERGATYFKTNIEVSFTMDFVGLPQTRIPVQQAIYTFSGFEFLTSGRNIELYDSGRITGASTYPSANNGWDFTSIDYALPPTSDGTLLGNNYNVGIDDNELVILANIEYEFGTDNTITTAVPDTDRFNRITSVRQGVTSGIVAYTDNDASTTGLRLPNNWNVLHGTTSPIGQFTFTGSVGEHFYFMYDATLPVLRRFQNVAQPTGNDINQFTVTTVGAFRIYTLTNPLPYNNVSVQYNIT